MNVISDIATYAATNGIGTLGTDLFYSILPANIDSGVVVVDTGGPAPDKYIPTKNPTFQFFVRSLDYDTGKAKLDAIRALFHQKSNLTIGSIYFYYIMAMSEGGHLGRDESNIHDLFSINFLSLTR